MTLGRVALARMPAIRCKINSLFSTFHLASSSMNLPSSPLSRHISMKTESLVSKLTSSGLLKTQGLIGGKWVDANDGNTIQVLNPATGEVIANVPCMGRRETDDAISSANDAFRLSMPSEGNGTGMSPLQEFGFHDNWHGVNSLPLRGANIYENVERYSSLLTDFLMLLPTCIARFDLLITHKEKLGQLITLEQGKPLKEAMGEVSYGASFIEFFAEEAKRVYGDIIPATLGDRRLFVLKQPVGVVGAITPWNFPLAMITRKVGPALACGCTVVVKPSELTPLTALAAAELALQAGIPPVLGVYIIGTPSTEEPQFTNRGVLNVVMGKAPDIGDALLASREVRKITFTGSTAVGKKLMAGAAGTVKRLSLELGGNAPCIVFDDADLDVAVKGSTYHIDTLSLLSDYNGFWTAIAADALIQDFENVFFLNDVALCFAFIFGRYCHGGGIYDKFADAFSKAVQSMQVGDGFSEGVVQGPLINEAAVQKVESFVQDAITQGAKVLLGGKRHSLGMTFYEPTVISNVTETMLLSREEVFGPVAPLLRFETEEEAIWLANNTNAGLAAYIFTNNVQRSWRVTEALEYGLVGVNEGIISTEVAPFGGVKQSGLGREGSKYGMDEYLEVSITFSAYLEKVKAIFSLPRVEEENKLSILIQ
ncbi:unnamed protein product [Dovyalis caffra]|uniref:Succinate-semialdehyde dehydrogenase, mitochondrial n=1 Tax=Dovyalis caffra TaxID=77055 RepID=A0AAV1QWI8_9ROSI|nr:unnamed protein product [Dovyalis caffra]